MCRKIDKQGIIETEEPEVQSSLGTVLILEGPDALEFDNQTFIDYEISPEIPERVTIKDDRDDPFSLVGDTGSPETNLHGIVVDAFRKPWTERTPYCPGVGRNQ
jgi:hypothetical protein